MARPQWMHPRLYQWVKPRSVGLHLAFVLIVAGCLVAMWWQVHRAMQGNTLSYLYSIEWPAFAVVAGIGWWLMVHDTPEDIAARRDFHHRMRQASAEVVARTLPRSASALTVGSEEVVGRRLDPGPAPAAIAGPSVGNIGEHPVRPVGLPAPSESEAALLEASLLDVADEPTDELTQYNRYLAQLALQGKPKTWRNPRGV